MAPWLAGHTIEGARTATARRVRANSVLEIKEVRTPVEVVEELVAISGDDERTFEHYAEDAEVTLIESDEVLRGLEAIRRYAATRPLEERPQLRTCTIHEVGNCAVVLTTLAFSKPREDGGSYTEIRPIGFVVRIDDGKVKRVEHFETWSAARTAAGLPADSPGRRVSLGRGFLMVADAVRTATRGLTRRVAAAN
jgi:ketosteroid isomerase-like protein